MSRYFHPERVPVDSDATILPNVQPPSVPYGRVSDLGGCSGCGAYVATNGMGEIGFRGAGSPIVHNAANLLGLLGVVAGALFLASRVK